MMCVKGNISAQMRSSVVVFFFFLYKRNQKGASSLGSEDQCRNERKKMPHPSPYPKIKAEYFNDLANDQSCILIFSHQTRKKSCEVEKVEKAEFQRFDNVLISLSHFLFV